MKKNRSENNSTLKKIEQLKSITWKINGVLLGCIAIVGIRTINRYVPLWLVILFGLSVFTLVVLYVVAYVIKKK
ncbi:MAG: hypothetical protein R3Y58_09150 [Eubacteriales bacterium]